MILAGQLRHFVELVDVNLEGELVDRCDRKVGRVEALSENVGSTVQTRLLKQVLSGSTVLAVTTSVDDDGGQVVCL